MKLGGKHIRVVSEAIDSLTFWTRHGEECFSQEYLKLLREVYDILNKMKGGE